MPTQIVQKTESLDFTEDDFIPQAFTPPESPPNQMFPKYIWVPEGAEKEVSSTPSVNRRQNIRRQLVPVDPRGTGISPRVLLGAPSFMKPPEAQTAQLQTVRPEELFRPATSLESSGMHWSLGGGLGSRSIEAMSPVPPSPTVTDASSASDVGNVCVSPAVGDKRKAIDATDASINAEAHVVQKCRTMGADENFGPKDDGEQINGTDYGTNIVAADGLSPDLKMWQGGLPPPQEHCSWHQATLLWISNMQQILSGMTFNQLQDANRLCPFPVKRRLILQDLGFIDADEAEQDFHRSLCDIAPWTLYPIPVVDMSVRGKIHRLRRHPSQRPLLTQRDRELITVGEKTLHSKQWSPLMITISHTGMRVNLLHHCQDITVFASRPSLSASFVGAVSDFLWPDVEGIEVDSGYSKPQATHLVIEGEQEEGIGQILVNDFVEQLTALHTAQLNFVIAGRVQTMAWKMPSLRRLYLWNSSVSPEGLQVLMKLLPNLTHFAVGGQDMTRIVEDHFGDDLFPDGEILKTLPANLVFLHIDVVALVGEKTSKTGNGVRLRTIRWLTLLDNHVPITTLELKLFTNDIRVGRNLLALCASTIQTIKLYFVDTFVGSAFVDLSNMPHLQHFHILTSELQLHELLNVVRTIRSPDFEDVNICTALTSFEHTFAGLKFWDNAYASQELRVVEVVNLSILVKELQPRTAVRSFYGELVTARIPHMQEDDFMHVFWFKDGGFLAGFADATVLAAGFMAIHLNLHLPQELVEDEASMTLYRPHTAGSRGPDLMHTI
ncbi:hypothetical protein ARMSODRAFT_977481 [Armillaria solidipes]|uniref:RNI-like protein n=1 Tax=Armillaria solidipes TaxID=1076256 RepID=A0A2H3BHR0_9AGAR|nr:hypothetical protein ARMSODRAFT_977481 [Armillaria solidipes]